MQSGAIKAVKAGVRLASEYVLGYSPAELRSMKAVEFARDTACTKGLRVNLVLPTLDKKMVFGGIATALDFFNRIVATAGCRGRIIVLDKVTSNLRKQYPNYEFLAYPNSSPESSAQISVCSVCSGNGASKPLIVSEDDWFICTYWLTIFRLQGVNSFQKEEFGRSRKIIYMIQDYEPGFFPWSANYLLAQSTYRLPELIAVINSKELDSYLELQGCHFSQKYCFHPTCNPTLREKLLEDPLMHKEKICLIYGRPRVKRNCYPLIIGALKQALKNHPELSNWKFFSVGATHPDIRLCGSAKIQSLGKLTLEEYAAVLRKASVGVSLMCSPHPSYPPMEMASFGLVTITNSYGPKDLSAQFETIVSLDTVSHANLAEAIYLACDLYSPSIVCDKKHPYLFNDNGIDEIVEKLAGLMIEDC